VKAKDIQIERDYITRKHGKVRAKAVNRLGARKFEIEVYSPMWGDITLSPRDIQSRDVTSEKHVAFCRLRDLFNHLDECADRLEGDETFVQRTRSLMYCAKTALEAME
jgi:hypothetical protein